MVQPLIRLLGGNVKCEWSEECSRIAKKTPAFSKVQVHFIHVRLATDASNHGIGAVMSHVFPNGNERPVAYASRTLCS